MSFNETFLAARQDIFKYATRMLNWHPSSQQEELLRAVQHESMAPYDERLKRIACKSGQGPGKTAATTVVASWRCLRAVDSMVVVTAPTQRQVKDVWMAELRRLMINAVPELQQLVEIDNFQMKVAGRKDWCIRTVAANRPENVQGYHQKYLTFVFDEASGIERPIWETVKGTLTNKDSLLLAIGNPNTNDCSFHDCFNLDRDLWHCLTWNAEESDHVDKGNISRIAREFGVDSDVYRVRVLGEFPRMDPDCVINQDDVESCTKLNPSAMAREPLHPTADVRQCGIDLARFGSDESVIIFRRNSAVAAMEVHVKKEPIKVIRRAFQMEREMGWEGTHYCFDAGGLGQGVAHVFHDHRKHVTEFHSNGSACDRNYKNKITEAWFQLRQKFMQQKIYVPRDPRMIKQLSTRKYKTRGDQVLLESKEDYVKRVGTEEATSPDRADALAMAFYHGLIAESQIATQSSGKSETQKRYRL